MLVLPPSAWPSLGRSHCAPGSCMLARVRLVWKQGRDLYYDRLEMPALETSLDLGALLDREPENVLLAKVTYWFSI